MSRRLYKGQTRAASWYCKAPDQLKSVAQSDLECRCGNGKGVAQNCNELVNVIVKRQDTGQLKRLNKAKK
jgi:hypothetical protein